MLIAERVVSWKQQTSALEFNTWLNSTSATISEKARAKEKGELTHIIKTAFLLIFDMFWEQVGRTFGSMMGCSLWRQEAAVCLRSLTSGTLAHSQQLDCAMNFSRVSPSTLWAVLSCFPTPLRGEAGCLWQHCYPFNPLSQVLTAKTATAHIPIAPYKGLIEHLSW